MDSHTLAVFHEDGSEDVLKTEYAIIATGSRPAMFYPLIKSPRLMNSTNALLLEDIPKRCWLSAADISVWNWVRYTPRWGQTDRGGNVARFAARALTATWWSLSRNGYTLMHEILLNTKVADMKAADDGVHVVLDGPDIAEPNRIFDKTLICVGRKPNSQGLNLHDTRITTDKRGFIEVDAQRRTAEPHIFAIGDVAGEPMLAHKASAEGKVAAEVIAGRKSA